MRDNIDILEVINKVWKVEFLPSKINFLSWFRVSKRWKQNRQHVENEKEGNVGEGRKETLV